MRGAAMGAGGAAMAAGMPLAGKVDGGNGVSDPAPRRGYLDGPFGQVHYYAQGAGPTLILLHQTPVSGRMFERAMPFLAAAGLRAIAIDTPGFGHSDAPPEPPSIQDYADNVRAVVGALGLKSAHILGHHTGASIATSFAALNPDMVNALVLNGTALFTPEELQQFAGVELKASPKHADGSHLLDAWKTRVRYTPGWTDLEAMHRRLVDGLWAGDTTWYGYNAAFGYDMALDLMALTARTMILSNTGDDIHHLSQKVHAMRPDFFAYAELEGGTHDIVDEQPEAWAQVVAAFVLGQ